MDDLSQSIARTPLVFDNDTGATRSKWIATALVIALVVWMGSGFIIPSESSDDTAEEDGAPVAVTVSVAPSVAEPVMQFFRAEGQTLPDRETRLQSETTGEIAEVLVEKGENVEAGQVIARFVTAQRAADLNGAREELARAQREFDNAETLLTIDVGEYVQSGVEVARIVDNSPLTVSVQVPQQSLKRLELGQIAQVQFITGEVHQGAVSFLATSADSETRTFLAEVTVENPDGTIPAGVVIFSEIEIVLAQPDGIWVGGLPSEARIITVGQGFVNDGEVVNPQLDAELSQ